ncbi:TetR/AcrR family transcriptional regulator [Nonomuraea sp. KC401]|uniref:TetR/AcrR family transcriptional regulator n=1 Tax=unclassified Nonomuraea TaxID=2593643 RepID=UPI0010FF42C2|nr:MULTISPECIES: TetR/AcrR family transcriptional regulator [unclassified Nonomuraea]NBE99782.1 TetR family transcriptional regulator [Nonomuraea sp. K271]TLF55656.1 TetR/AcrR family transcriptional regulator [Nonomuraea sp. KC401]
MATRKYEQRLRAEAAQETRRRILDAVYQRLREAPSEPVSIDRIARMARVARPTVYLVFGSRAGLFDAVGADLLQRGGFDRMLQASAHPDAREALRGAIHAIVEMYAAHRDVLRVLASMALLDTAAVGGAVQRMEQGRATGMAELAQHLDKQGSLRPDVTLDQATDLLWLLTSFDSFDLLHSGRNLPLDQTSATLTTTAERSLCR